MHQSAQLKCVLANFSAIRKRESNIAYIMQFSFHNYFEFIEYRCSPCYNSCNSVHLVRLYCHF